MKKFVLFAARHQVPDNDGALCEEFDFTTFCVKSTPNWEEALRLLEKGETVSIIVTGLTPALTLFMQAYFSRMLSYVLAEKTVSGFGNLTLLHYDRVTKLYHPQHF